MSCGCAPVPVCSAPAAASAPCGLSANAVQPPKINAPHADPVCPVEPACACAPGVIPHFPAGVSQLSGESYKRVWNF